MKMHVATDDIIGIVTNAVYGPANEHDISRARELIPSETEHASGHENGTDFLLKRNVCRNVWNGQISVKSLKMERT